MNKLMMLIALTTMSFFTFACGGGGGEEQAAADTADKGIGPVKSVFIGAPDDVKAAEGKKIFEAKCTACHKTDTKYIGPALKGVTKKRTPEWIMNMIMNPEQMIKENEAAKALFAEYMTPMANQNITQDEARAILEYFLSLDK
jgi:mono/diheme cytochrome c family protein